MTFVYLDLKVDDQELGRLVFELNDEKAPLICEKFMSLTHDGALNSLEFTKVIKNFMIQIIAPSTELELDSNENLENIEQPFLLCVSNFNPFSFFITLESSPHLNNKHTVFAKVKYGKSIVRYIEKLNVISNRQGERDAWVPLAKIKVAESGIWKLNDPLPNTIACTDTIAGDIFEEYPDDNEALEGIDFDSPESSFKVIEIIKISATTLLKSGELEKALLKYQKAVRYCNELLPDNGNNKEWHDKFQTMKMTLFLNITLVTLNLKQYQNCIDYCHYIFAMEGINMLDSQVSKVFYRLAKAQMGINKKNDALETLEKAHLILPNDPIIAKELKSVNTKVLEDKKAEKVRYAKFFS